MTQIASVPSVACFLGVSPLAGPVAEFVCKLSGLSGSRLTALVPSNTQHIFPWLPLFEPFFSCFRWFPVFELFLVSSGVVFRAVFLWSAGPGGQLATAEGPRHDCIHDDQGANTADNI